MKSKSLILTLLLFIILVLNINFVNAELECNFKNTACKSDESVVFWTNSERIDQSGEVLNSPISIEENSIGYTKRLCCKDTNTKAKLEFSIENIESTNLDKSIMFFNGEQSTLKYNLVAGIRYYNGKIDTNFNKNFYEHSLILKSNIYSTLDIKVVTKEQKTKYENMGYKCIYRTSNIINGVVSSCDASYPSGQYDYMIFGKLKENIQNLKCSDSCTSLLDKRVYSDCGLKIESCKSVPEDCDGMLEGSWSRINNTHEIKCSKNWDITRYNPLNTKIEIKAKNNDCENLISTTYPVILNNEIINMKIYTCEGSK